MKKKNIIASAMLALTMVFGMAGGMTVTPQLAEPVQAARRCNHNWRATVLVAYIIAIVDILATDRPFSVQNVMHQNSDILIDIIKCNDELPAKMPAAFLLEKTAYCMYKVE